MQKEPLKDLIYLSSSQILPFYLQRLRGVRWYRAQGPSDLKEVLKSQQGEVHVIVRSDYLSLRAVQAFLSWGQVKVKASFIFIAQTIEKSVHQVALSHPHVLILRESERAQIGALVTRRLFGQKVQSRRQERMVVQAQVMLKKSIATEQSPTGAWVQYLQEGFMVDFSEGGAQITLGREVVQKKDFLNLMYKNQQGVWVSIETQVRWVSNSAAGAQIIGVQFLAMSA